MAGQPTPERPPLESFLDQYWEDRESGHVQSIRTYLELFPGDDDAIVREYVMLQESGRAEDSARSDESSIGPYRTISEIGRGGQGVVYLAEDQRLNRHVALKVLTHLGPDSEALVQRFQREAQVASRLEHPGICSVHDAGVESGVPYIAMQLVNGESLAERITKARKDATTPEHSFVTFDEDDVGDPPTAADHGDPKSVSSSSTSRREVDAVLTVFEKAARALHAAHESGVVHRDIKPGNIMVSKDGQPVILDFGLARADDLDIQTLTRTGDLFGTPAYMSPEQLTRGGIRLDRRTDVYSLGASLYECLTLHRPFEAATREALYQVIMTEEPPDPRKFNSRISSDLKVVLETALAKNRDERYATAEAFADDVCAAREIKPITARPVRMFGRLKRWARRRPARAALVALLILGTPILAGLAGYIYAHREDIEAQAQVRLERRVARITSQGYYELTHGSLDRARAEFEAALELLPDSGEAAAGLVFTLLKQDSPESARNVLDRTVAVRPELERLRVRVLRALQKDEEAAELEASFTTPKSALGAFLAGTDELLVGHELGESTAEGRDAFRRAQREFERANALSESARSLYYGSYVHAASHLPDGRLPAAAFAITALWPEDGRAWYWSARAMRESGRLETALEHCERARELGVSNQLDHALVLTRLGRHTEAETLIRERIDQKPDDANGYRDLVPVLLNLERYDEVLEVAEQALALEPDNRGFRSSVAIALSELGKTEDALVVARELVIAYPSNFKAHEALARVLKKAERYAEVIEPRKRALDLAPARTRPSLLDALGSDYLFVGDSKAARPYLEEASRLGQDTWELWNNLSAARMAAGDKKGTLEAAARAIALEPDNPHVRTNLGRFYLVLNDDPERAEKELKIALDADPAFGDALSLLGLLYSRTGRNDDALAIFERALAVTPDDPVVNHNLGNHYGANGEPDRALPHLEKAAATGSAESLYRLAVVYGQLNRIDDCMEAYRQAIAADPEYAEAHCNLGDWHRQRREYAKAVEHIRKGHELGSMRQGWPYPSDQWLLRALRLHAVGLLDSDPEKEIPLWREILELAPDDAFALTTLAAIRVDEATPNKLRDPASGLSLASRAVTLTDGKRPVPFHVLAAALFASGLPAAAIEAQETAIGLMNGGDVRGLELDEARARLGYYRAKAKR